MRVLGYFRNLWRGNKMQEVCDRIGIGYKDNMLVYYCGHTKKECVGDKTEGNDVTFQDSLDLSQLKRCPLNSFRDKLSEATQPAPQAGEPVTLEQLQQAHQGLGDLINQYEAQQGDGAGDA